MLCLVGHYCLGRKGCSQNTPQKRKKLWIVITWLHHSASTKLEIHMENWVWICLDSIFDRFWENKIQGSQACRILLGSMVGIYWIYALFGGHYCLGRKGCSQNTPQKRKTTMDYDYLITPFCFYKAWNTYLKIGFGYVWIQYLIDFVEMRFQLISQTHRLTLNPSVLFLEHFGCWLGTFLILFLEPLDFIFANPSVGWLMIFSLRNMWGWTPLISFLHFGGQ